MWAVGCIFAELLTLKPLFQGAEVKATPNPFQVECCLWLYMVSKFSFLDCLSIFRMQFPKLYYLQTFCDPYNIVFHFCSLINLTRYSRSQVIFLPTFMLRPFSSLYVANLYYSSLLLQRPSHSRKVANSCKSSTLATRCTAYTRAQVVSFFPHLLSYLMKCYKISNKGTYVHMPVVLEPNDISPLSKEKL